MLNVLELARESLRRAGFEFTDLSVIELNRSSLAEGAAHALLAFADQTPEPIAVIKLHSVERSPGALRCEYDNLVWLHGLGSPALKRSVPAPLDFGPLQGFSVMAQSVLPGRRMKNLAPDRYFHSTAFRADLAAVGDWLVEFQSAVEPHAAGLPTLAGDDGLTRACATYRERFSVSPALDTLLDDAACALAGAELPAVPFHGDFCTANVLLGPDAGIGVIDWEGEMSCCWPLADLLHFLASVWALPYSRVAGAQAANYRKMFFSDHDLSRLARTVAHSYLDRVGVTRRLALPLSVACWVTYANRKYDALPPSCDREAESHYFLPLIIFEGGGCLNLELLAERRAEFILGDD